MNKNNVNRSARRSNSLYIITGVLAISAIAGYFIWRSGRTVEPGKYDAFAACLTEKHAVMYGAYWCPHCQNQKKLFGSSFDKVTYVECAIRGSQAQQQACIDAGIKGYPTWVFADDSRKSGEISLQDLASTTGCALPQ